MNPANDDFSTLAPECLMPTISPGFFMIARKKIIYENESPGENPGLFALKHQST